MNHIVRVAVTLLALVIFLPGSAVATDEWPSTDRVYLLGSGDEFLYWSTDATDPELGAERVERQCSVAILKGLPGSKRCDFIFLPGALIRGPLTWGPGTKLRFHLRLDVETAGTPTVRVTSGSQQANQQADATEVTPGVWEADVSKGGINPSSWSTFTVSVTADVQHLTATLHLGGDSYVDLPTPVQAAGVPRLLAESPVPTKVETAATALRSFTFNDDQWSLASFSGDLTQTKDFEVLLSQKASSVIAWVELYGTPLLHDVARGRDPDVRKTTDGTRIELRKDGTRIAMGSNSGVYGVGIDTAVAMDVASGPVVLHVDSTDIFPTDVNHGSPYTAHILTVYGERTLARMTWPGMFGGYPADVLNMPLVSRCPGSPQQQIPVSTKVASLAVDMRVDSVGGPTSQWALAYLLQPNSWFLCDDGSGGRSMRFTYPNHGVQLVGATIKRDTTYAESRATAFEFEARFTYSSPVA